MSYAITPFSPDYYCIFTDDFHSIYGRYFRDTGFSFAIIAIDTFALSFLQRPAIFAAI
jgi:hypothetical protein